MSCGREKALPRRGNLRRALPRPFTLERTAMSKKPNQDIRQAAQDILAIDKTRLDEEWLNQHKLFFKWSCDLADAEKDISALHRELKIARAEADYEIRSGSSSKPTEAQIKSEVEMDDEVCRVESAIINAKHRVDVLKGMATALMDRRRALENAVTLHGQQYFSSPRSADASTMKDQIDTARTRRNIRPIKRKAKE